jgi:hypothetical protein
MEEVRDALLAGDGEKAKQLLEKMEQEYAALKRAYSG